MFLWHFVLSRMAQSITSSCSFFSKNQSLNSLDVSLSFLPSQGSHFPFQLSALSPWACTHCFFSLLLWICSLALASVEKGSGTFVPISVFLPQTLSWLYHKSLVVFPSHFFKDFDAHCVFFLKGQKIQVFLSWWFLVSFSLYFSF